jgi:hypothetical protein
LNRHAPPCAQLRTGAGHAAVTEIILDRECLIARLSRVMTPIGF